MMYFIVFMHVLLATYVDMHSYNWQNHMAQDYFDLTEECRNGTSKPFFIPYGTGASSSQVIMITNLDVEGENPLYCEVQTRMWKLSESQVQIMVIEYFVNVHDYDEIMRECRSDNAWNYLELRENINGSPPVHVCDLFKPSKHITPVSIYVSEADIVSLTINPKGNTVPMKITVSIGRKIDRHDECLPVDEIYCFIGKELICLQSNLACDGNNNCGVFLEYDEDSRDCLVQDNTGYWFAVLIGICLLIGVYVIFVFIIKSYIPKISDNFFIFNEDKENKLMLKSRLNTHIWQKPKKKINEDEIFCACQDPSDTSISIFTD